MNQAHKLAISKALKGHLTSPETRRKIALAKRKRVVRPCAYCEKPKDVQPSKAARYKRHFCSTKCYSLFRSERLPKEEHNNWKGGFSPYEVHKRWVSRNKERMSHLKARRYARERGAEGSHTFEEWTDLKTKFGNKCTHCKQEKSLTKDHILPLSAGGSDYISNIQPLCRNCNSKKWKTIPVYENPSLLTP